MMDGIFPKLTATFTAAGLTFSFVSAPFPDDGDVLPVDLKSVVYDQGIIYYERVVNRETAGDFTTVILDPDPDKLSPDLCKGGGTAHYTQTEEPRKIFELDDFVGDPRGCLERLEPGQYRGQTVVIPRSGGRPDVIWFDLVVDGGDVELFKVRQKR